MFPFRNSCRTFLFLLAVIAFYNCSAQSAKDTIKLLNTASNVARPPLRYKFNFTKINPDGSKVEIDTITGYHKIWYKNGNPQMEGKVTKASPKDYRDGIWKYYNEAGQLMNQETYTKEGKINQWEYKYFTNGKPMSETYQYYEGNYKDKATFKFHKVETLFYTNGQPISERHWINGVVVDEKCWDPKGNAKPIGYLKTVKTVSVDEK